MKWTTVDLN